MGYLLRSYGTFLLVAAAWLLAVPLFKIEPRYLPSLIEVVRDGASVWDDLVAGLCQTLLETLAGFALGAGLGIVLGVAFAYVRTLERAVFPIFVALQTVPVIAFGAIVVMWFGNTVFAKVVIALYLTFFPVAVSTLRGLQACDPQRIQLLRSFGASRLKILLKLALPGALPTIMVGLRLGVSLSLAGAIVGEWFGDTVGIGVMLLQALYFEQILRIWLLIVVSGFTGMLLLGVLDFVERRYVWWHKG
jgi:NitT/TauT family transport system permease protein